MPGTTIPFDELEHAHGSAADVPTLLAALRGTDAKAAKRALRELGNALVHQHSVYSASAAAVSPLLDLVLAPKGLLRADILSLLAEIMLGDPDAAIDGGRDMTRPEVRARFADAASAPYLEAYETLVARADDVLMLATDADAKVRAHAAFLLAFLSDGAGGRLEPVLAALSKERTAAPKACLALAAGLMARYASSPIAAQPLRALATKKAPDLVAAAATLGWIWSDEAEAPAEAFDRLAHFAEHRPKTPSGFPFGDLGGLAEQVLFRLRPPPVEPLLEELARVATKDSMDPAWKRAQQLSTTIRKLLFEPTRREEDPWIGAELDDRQRAYLRLVAEHELGVPNADYFGLPRQSKTQRRLVGDTVGALDLEVEITVGSAQRRWPIWRIVRGLVDRAMPTDTAIEAIAAQLDTEQRRAAADELESKTDHWELRLPRAGWSFLPEDEGKERRQRLDQDLRAIAAALRA